MNKEFIPYEQALALKELGFDEPCFKGYTEEYKTLIAFSNTHTNTSVRNTLPTKPFTAPLYQQAFRWFREKHKLYHTINMFGDWDKPQYSYLVSGRTMNNPAHMWHFEDKDSHEEAELACLIKLIEIVKNNE
jgi:hypothetical protein